VQKSLDSRKKVCESGEIIILDQFCPWDSHLDELEKELSISPLIKYVLFSDTTGQVRIRAVSLTPNSFESRKSLPSSWRGLRDDELSQVSGIQGCVFAHASGFIGGNLTMEGAIQMAKKALESSE
jgi:uncharacterized UPF0160 family protein